MTRSLSILLLATLPFQFALPFPGVGDVPIIRLLALILLAGFLIEALLRRSWHLPPPFFTAALISFLSLAGVSVLWAVRPEFALPKVAFLLNTLPLVFVWHDRMTRNGEIPPAFIKATLAGAASAAIVAIAFFLAQFVFGVSGTFHFLLERVLPFFLGREFSAIVASYPSLLVNLGGETVLRATAVFPDPHVAAYFFGLTGFLALGAMRLTGQTRYTWAAATLFAADLLTFSRGGYLGLVGGFLVYASMSLPASFSFSRARIGLVLFASLSIGVILWSPVSSRFLTSFSLSDASSTERLALWREAVSAIAEHPVLGVGLGNYLATARPLLPPETPFYAHNLYLDIALELGLVGLLSLLALVGYALGRSILLFRDNPLAPPLAAGLVLYLVHSLVETALFSVHVTFILVLILVLALTLKRREA